MAFQNEQVAKAIKVYLETNLSAALDTVEAYWSGKSDSVTLPNPVTWFYGYKPTVLEMAVDEFPFVAVLTPAREPDTTTRAEWGFQSQLIHGYVDYAVTAVDETTVNKVGSRYGEAILACLAAQRSFEGYEQVNSEPPISQGSLTRHLKDGANADAFSADDVYFLSIHRIAVDLMGG